MGETKMGRLTVITGPMWAGKTTRIIQMAKESLWSGKDVVAYRPSIDNRYSTSAITSHDGLSIEAWTLDTNEPFIPRMPQYKTIILDECHFYPLRFAYRVQTMKEEGYNLICSGIHIDCDGKAVMPTMDKLMQFADNVEILTAECVRCGEVVHYTKRRKDAPEGSVGGAERYVNLCDRCVI